jgi:hypothetical protein
MNTKYIGWGCALIGMFAGAAQAQTAGTVTLTASPSSGTGSVTPKLTWSTNPVATSCTASGGWSGTKAASGNQTLTAIKSNTNYTLTCTWGAAGTATIAWTAPTKNTDGSNLTNLASYKVLYGTSSTSFTHSKVIDDPTSTRATITALTPATWYFTVHSVTTGGVESSNSNVASKSVKGATAAKTIAVTVSASSGGSLTTKATNVWDVIKRSDGAWVRNAVVGTIPLGKPCYTSFRAGPKHYLVNRSDVTRMYATAKSTNRVGNCVGD